MFTHPNMGPDIHRKYFKFYAMLVIIFKK